MGFTRLKSDASIYVYVKGELRIIVPVYVDDITFACKDSKLIDKAVEDLSKHFKLRDLGPTEFILGVHVVRNRANRTITLSQRQYIVDMLERYGMAECNSIGTRAS